MGLEAQLPLGQAQRSTHHQLSPTTHTVRVAAALAAGHCNHPCMQEPVFHRRLAAPAVTHLFGCGLGSPTWSDDACMPPTQLLAHGNVAHDNVARRQCWPNRPGKGTPPDNGQAMHQLPPVATIMSVAAADSHSTLAGVTSGTCQRIWKTIDPTRQQSSATHL